MTQIIYFSSSSGNTQRFIDKLALPAKKIPDDELKPEISAEVPFVLICPTFADGKGRGAVPKRVIHFLNKESNRTLLRGVIASGNRNFGHLFAQAGDVISAKCNVPVLYRFELSGTDKDIHVVRNGLMRFWKHLC